MSRIIDRNRLFIKTSHSPIAFETTGGGSWPVWDRFISISGKKAIHIGNICGTCGFFFKRVEELTNKPVNSQELIAQLNQGLQSIDKPTLTVLQKIIPEGYFEVLLLTIRPRLIKLDNQEDYFKKEQAELWGRTDSYGAGQTVIDYYRGTDVDIEGGRKIFEFFIPLTSPATADKSRVDYYKQAIFKGAKPTALGLTVLDVKEPACWPDEEAKITSHWCLAHYILDGHHKLLAASALESELTLLSFFARRQGISTKAEQVELLDKI